MNMLEWCQNSLNNSKNQELLNEKVELLLQGPLKEKNVYQQEKAIKSFAEPISYLESLLSLQKGIVDGEQSFEQRPGGLEELFAAMDEIEFKVASEINRQYRHFIEFL